MLFAAVSHFWHAPVAMGFPMPPKRSVLRSPQNSTTHTHTPTLQENTVWEGGAYARVAVPMPGSNDSSSSGVNVTLAVALSVCLVATIVVVGVATKYIQRKVRGCHYGCARPLTCCPWCCLSFPACLCEVA